MDEDFKCYHDSGCENQCDKCRYRAYGDYVEREFWSNRQQEIVIDKRLDGIKEVRLTSNAIEKANEIISKLDIKIGDYPLDNIK